jgi:hypothetical protein
LRYALLETLAGHAYHAIATHSGVAHQFANRLIAYAYVSSYRIAFGHRFILLEAHPGRP